jgi:two-component system cell cycle sensor histidine kinase PleC
MRHSRNEDQARHSLLRHYVRTAGTSISRRRARRTLGAARIEAELANRVKTEFLANMSHELRTPLNAIIGFADMIGQMPGGGKPEKIAEYTAHIGNAGRHLLGLLSDILDIAHIDVGTYKVDLALSDLARVVELSAARIKERVAAKHQLLSVIVEGKLPYFMIDERRLQQALSNLLVNACQYTPEGGYVGLRCGRTADGGVAIVVSDNGRGMSEEELRRALAPFANLQHAYAANDGLALGVAVAKRLVELQGASFSMTSVVGEGTQAEIKFRAASPVAEGDGLPREGA